MTDTFHLIQTTPDSGARAGELVTPHGTVPTPVFLPVGSQATVKTLTPEEIKDIGFKMLLANTYHLYLRPGTEVIEKMGGLFNGGLAAFYQWDTAMAMVLFVLAIASATFIRLRKRAFKGIALMTLACISTAIIGHILWDNQGLFGFLAISVLSLLFLLSPLLIQTSIGHSKSSGEEWWSGDWLEHPSSMR